MMSRGLASCSAIAGAALAFLVLWGPPALSQGSDIDALLQQAEQLTGAAKYAEAMPIAQRALDLARARFGENHVSVAQGLSVQARLNRLQGRYAEAEPLYKQALAIYERTLGPNHALTAVGLNNLAILYFSLTRFEEAEPLYKRALVL